MNTLKIVATPIGNLEDFSFRAVRTLQEADYILCEDTRVTRKLLDRYEIKTPAISYHQHSGELKIGRIMELLAAGKNLALVTDAGTPGISDPGGKLVSLVREKFGDRIKIESVPGVSAIAAAVSIAGAGFDRFLFLGFLPNKKGRQTMLREIMTSEYPVILYESKHRIVKLLEELKSLGGEEAAISKITVARELTKMHETLYQGTPTEILAELNKDPNYLKGEFVVLINK